MSLFKCLFSLTPKGVKNMIFKSKSYKREGSCRWKGSPIQGWFNVTSLYPPFRKELCRAVLLFQPWHFRLENWMQILFQWFPNHPTGSTRIDLCSLKLAGLTQSSFCVRPFLFFLFLSFLGREGGEEEEWWRANWQTMGSNRKGLYCQF